MRFTYKSLLYDLKHYANATVFIPIILVVVFLSTDFVRWVEIVTPPESYLRHDPSEPYDSIKFIRRKLRVRELRSPWPALR